MLKFQVLFLFIAFLGIDFFPTEKSLTWVSPEEAPMCYDYKGNSFDGSAMSLVPIGDMTHTAVRSGAWSDPATWNGNIPNNDSRVFIPTGIRVSIRSQLEARHKILRIDGVLDFDPQRNTHLQVETIISTTGGVLTIGTASEPIGANVTAKITIIDDGPLDLSWDYGQFSKGLIIMGNTTAYGATKSAWHPLQDGARSGSRQITLRESPLGWQPGDEIVITGTAHNNPESDEKRSIIGITGNVITLDRTLELNHLPPVSDLEVHVANLTRNIVIESENSDIKRRGHLMFMHNLDVDWNYVRLHKLGRTNKRVQEDDWFFPTLVADEYYDGARTNIRGRYSCHFHRGGVDPATTSPARIKGCVVEDNPGWGFVNHSSNVDFIENVAYNVVGGAFQTEAGNEIGSFVRNIAIRTVNPDYPILNPETEPVDIREKSQDFSFQGDGFWFHGGGVSVEGNVASGNSGHGFIYWTEGLRETGTEFDLQNMFKVAHIPNGNLLGGLENIQSWWIPLRSFKNNTAYSSSKGFAAYYMHATLFEDIRELTDAYLATVHSYLEDFTIWNVRKYGIEIYNSERFTFKNLRMLNPGDPDVIGIYNTLTVARESNWENCNIEGFGIGMIPAMQGKVAICGGEFSNLTDFMIVPPQRDSRAPGWDRDLRIDGTIFNNSRFFNENEVKHFELKGNTTDLAATAPFVELDFYHKFFMIPDRVVVNIPGLAEKRLYYDEQAATYVPVTGENIYEAEGTYRNDILNKTNQQLRNSYGLSYAGALVPSDAENHPFVSGGKISDTDVPMNIPVCHFIDERLKVANSYDDFDFYACWNTGSSKVAGQTTPDSFDCDGACDSCETCEDNIQNGLETGVDCGGPDCVPCETAPTCEDGLQNGAETGIDCGGPDCVPCETAPTCEDGLQNGDETGIDCGGPDCVPCAADCPVPVELYADNIQRSRVRLNWSGSGEVTSYRVQIRFAGQERWYSFTTRATFINVRGISSGKDFEWRVQSTCSDSESDWSSICTFTGNDPESGVCSGSAPTCEDGLQNGDETGVDCGGSSCAPCEPVPTCEDGLQNGDETGIDCGGPDCAPCEAAPTCGDGLQNGDETGIDCGGTSCEPCEIAPTCEDGLQNGDETGVDCGGSDCAPCSACSSPQAIYADNISRGRARLNWEEVASADQYLVEVRIVGSNRWYSLRTGRNEVTVRGIANGRDYEWRVTSICGGEAGEPSAICSFTGGDETSGSCTNGSLKGKVDDGNLVREIKIYPNPVGEILTLKAWENSVGTVRVSIIDLQGKILTTHTFDAGQEMKVDVSGCSPGLHLLRIENQGLIVNKKFIKN